MNSVNMNVMPVLFPPSEKTITWKVPQPSQKEVKIDRDETGTTDKTGGLSIKILRCKVDALSFVNHVEVFRSSSKIIKLIIAFNKQNPNGEQQEYSKTGKSNIFFTHRDNYHRVVVDNPVDIKFVLQMIRDTHQWKDNSNFEIHEPMAKL